MPHLWLLIYDINANRSPDMRHGSKFEYISSNDMSAKSLLELLKYYRQCLSRHLHDTGSNAEPTLFKTHF